MTLLRAAAAAQGGAAKGSRKEARSAPTAAEAGNGLERRNGKRRGEERKKGERGDLCSGHPNGLTPGRCTPPCKQGTVLVLTSPVTVHARYLKEMLAPTNGG